jgi:hypothetical protein
MRKTLSAAGTVWFAAEAVIKSADRGQGHVAEFDLVSLSQPARTHSLGRIGKLIYRVRRRRSTMLCRYRLQQLGCLGLDPLLQSRFRSRDVTMPSMTFSSFPPEDFQAKVEQALQQLRNGDFDARVTFGGRWLNDRGLLFDVGALPVAGKACDAFLNEKQLRFRHKIIGKRTSFPASTPVAWRSDSCRCCYRKKASCR